MMEQVEVGEIFTISDHEGQEQEIEVLGTVNIEGSDYVAVGFVCDLNNEDEDLDIFFMKIDDEGELAELDSDEEFDKVSTAFEEILVGMEAIE